MPPHPKKRRKRRNKKARKKIKNDLAGHVPVVVSSPLGQASAWHFFLPVARIVPIRHRVRLGIVKGGRRQELKRKTVRCHGDAHRRGLGAAQCNLILGSVVREMMRASVRNTVFQKPWSACKCMR